ncbi:MAG: hypothetical protein K8S55_10015 [Phycisphaerae bacterium]|nr:hypothetical protein [Phycisphaerae bacterium]
MNGWELFIVWDNLGWSSHFERDRSTLSATKTTASDANNDIQRTGNRLIFTS